MAVDCAAIFRRALGRRRIAPVISGGARVFRRVLGVEGRREIALGVFGGCWGFPAGAGAGGRLRREFPASAGDFQSAGDGGQCRNFPVGGGWHRDFPASAGDFQWMALGISSRRRTGDGLCWEFLTVQGFSSGHRGFPAGAGSAADCAGSFRRAQGFSGGQRGFCRRGAGRQAAPGLSSGRSGR